MSRRYLNLAFAYGTSLLTLAITVCLGRWMEDAEFGLVFLGLAIGTFTSLTVTFGASHTLVRDYVALATPQAKTALFHANLARSGLIAVVMLAGGAVAAACQTNNWRHALALTLLTGWATLRGLLPTPWYDLTGHIWLQNLLNVVERLVCFALLAVVWLMPREYRTALCFGAILFSVRLLIVAAQWIVFWRLERTEFPFDWRLLRPSRAAGTSVYVWLSFMASAVASHGTQIVIRSSGSDAQLAAYGMSFQLMNMVILFQTQSLRFVLPGVARACHQGQGAISRSLLKNSVLLGVASVGLAACAAVGLHLLPFIMQRAAFQMAPSFAIPLCSWVIVLGIAQVSTQHALCLRLDRPYFVLSLVCGGLAAAMGIWLIPLYGPIGAAYVLVTMTTLKLAGNWGMLVLKLRELRKENALTKTKLKRNTNLGSPTQAGPENDQADRAA